MKLQSLFLAFGWTAMAQHVTVPDTCTMGFGAGTSVVTYPLPYTYKQVMSIIGSYKNLTWSGNPPNTVKLNGTDNKVGTARTYHLLGATLIETILKYSKPANGPYVEVHNTALLTLPSLHVSLYIPFDGTVVSEICGGRASRFNFTAHFCANDTKVGKMALDGAHSMDAETVGKFLGGEKFKSCSALKSMSGGGGGGGGGGNGGSGGGNGAVNTPLPMFAAAVAVGSATLIAALLLL